MATTPTARVVCPHCQREIDHVLCCYLPTKELNRPPVLPADAKGAQLGFELLPYAPLYACPQCRKVLGVLGSFAHNESHIGTINTPK